MKRNQQIKNILLPVILMVIGLISCKKDQNGGVAGTVGGKGVPVINSIHTLSKTATDTIAKMYSTYDSTGTATQTPYNQIQTSVTAFDSTTVTGNLGNYYVIMGKNLGSTTQILINGVSIYFNRALNSDNTVIFNIPSTIPYVQPQANIIKIITLYGSVTYGFTTLPPPPTIVSASDYNFSAGTQLTLKGQGFAAVTNVALKTGGTVVSIVSQSDSVIVLKMPTTASTRSALLFTYVAAGKTLQAGSTAEFVSIENNYQIFVNGAYQNSWANSSWANPSGASASAPSKSGKGSIVATYPAGGWQIEGMANYYPGINYDASYKYLTFWIKGGVADHKIVLVGDKMVGGYGQVQVGSAYAAQLLTVKANVWNYFKIPLTNDKSVTSALDFWATGTNATQLGFFLQGMSGDVNETMYIDEVMFVK